MAELMAIDIETYSDVSLPDCGVHRYASSPQFEILLFAYSIDDGEIGVVDLASGEEMPEEVMECLKDDAVIKTAFNAAFERTCINRFFHLDLQPKSWRCTAVQASMLSLPLSLEGVGEALKLDKKKMTEGKELIRYFCIPCKPTKSNRGRTRNLPVHAPEKWELFKTYCIRDVAVEMQIRKKLQKFPIPDKEQELYCMDQRINDRGILVDRELITHAVACDLLYKEAASKSFSIWSRRGQWTRISSGHWRKRMIRRRQCCMRSGQGLEVRRMTAETMMKEYRSLKRELSVTGFQLQRFEGISENEMIESMLYSRHEGERVQTSTLSDKTAGIAVNYRKIMERENDGWYQYLFNRYLYLSEEIDFFERSVSALSGQLPGVVMDLVEGELTWENIAAKYHVSTAMIAKYKKKAAVELEKMYGFRDKQVEAYVLG